MIKTTKVSAYDIEESLITELSYLESLNPCHQTYYMEESSFLIQYQQTVDIFNFLPKLAFKVKLKIIGKPYSVSDKGYYGDPIIVSEMIKKLKGLKVILNADQGLSLPSALTLSSHVFHNHFKSFEEYLLSLRSHYRYRVNKALKKSSHLVMTKMTQNNFTRDHHKLYLEVYENSNDQLECLTLDFFREFPSEIYEFKCTETNELVGFLQLVQKEKQLTFLFGGFKQDHNREYDLYMNMLIKIIEIGINRGVKTIEFGQTAEETKLKLGCVAVEKVLYIHHSNKILNYMLSKLLPLLSYKPHGIHYHVYKEKR